MSFIYIYHLYYQRNMEFTEQEQIRRQKLEDIQKQGIEPYPADLWEMNFTSREMLDGFDSDPDKFTNISFAGRIMSVRDMGKAAFAVLQDSAGRIQIYVRRDYICRYWDVCI